MADTDDRGSTAVIEESPVVAEHRAAGAPTDSVAAMSGLASSTPARPARKGLWWAGAVIGLALAGYALTPIVKTALNTISTDDAYINGHATYVAPRVAGQVSRVLVDDNERVKAGDLLVQLDREPYQVEVDIKRAALAAAEADLEATRADVRSNLAQLRSQRWQLQRAIEQVDDSVAQLKARVATLRSREASRDRADADFTRAQQLYKRQAIAREEFDKYREAARTAEANVKEALEQVHATRVALGLAPQPEGQDLAAVPADLNQNFSAVLQALNQVVQTATQLGLPLLGANRTPQQALDEFIKRDKNGDIDRIMERMVPEAPAVKQAETKLVQAQRNLAQAELELRYCDIVSEIDGVVTGRNVNPGNHVQVGQSLMAVRSLTEVWIDANFKETQLADLRIGQRVRCEADMYGSHKEFEGRITGFTMGTGQTLSLLPPQNATGNFVKIVQRLPVRIELAGYDPDKLPLFVGLSVVPYVYYKERPTGPHAGELLQPFQPRPQGHAVSTAAETSQLTAPLPDGRTGR